MYYSYVLKSLKDQKKYYGVTQDIKKRLKEHNSGKVKSTKSRKPFELIYYEEFLKFEEARKRELYFKSGLGREYLSSLLK